VRIDEAKHLAELLKPITNVRVLGVKSVGDGKALVISIDRRGRVQIANPENAVGKVAKAAGAHGHAFERLDICSACFHKLKSEDRHYHMGQALDASTGMLQPICCRCVKRQGKVCKTGTQRLAPADADREEKERQLQKTIEREVRRERARKRARRLERKELRAKMAEKDGGDLGAISKTIERNRRR
jgi:hypothetical protein